MSQRKIFLGIDSSTQSLSATLIDADAGRIIAEESVIYDEYFSSYGIENGVLRLEGDGVIHSSPLMWADALDLLLEKLKNTGAPLGEVTAIAGSGQQHGSVYLNSSAEQTLAGLRPDRMLREQLADIFSRETAPVWMDSSTQSECDEIEQAVGGKDELIRITGSAAFRRFTGPQIRKFYKEQKTAYEETVCIQLVSSFMASVLAGRLVPIDPGDGAGMNMMDISTKEWSQKALDAVAPELREKLLPVMPSDTCAGTISPYFREKYGFSDSAEIILFSGDNPCSSIGVGLVSPGTAAVSLGTSDTMFSYMTEPNMSLKGEGVVFGSPAGGYMSLVCMSNGSLAREKVRDLHGLDWDGFSAVLRETEPGNGGKVMLPWFEQEIYPPLSGVRRIGFSEKDVNADVRGVVEGQALAMKIHTEWMGVPTNSICMTGGASVNPEIRQIFADVFQARVYRFETPNSASLGAALRAYHSYMSRSSEPVSWTDAVKPFTSPVEGSETEPDTSLEKVYTDLRSVYMSAEENALNELLNG